MSVAIITRPNAALGSTYNWLALGNPCVYKFLRSDYTATQVNNSGGFAQPQFNGVNLTSFIAVNDLLYFSQTGKVQTVSAVSFSGGNTLVTLDATYTASGTPYINIMKRDYVLEVEIWKDLATDVLLTTIKVTSNSVGDIYCDVSIIRAFVTADNTLDYTSGTNYMLDTDNNIKFFIKYKAVWTGSAESQTSDSANPFYGMLAAMQVNETDNPVLKAFIMNDAVETTKFLTRNTLEQKIFRKDDLVYHPYDLSFILANALVHDPPNNWVTLKMQFKDDIGTLLDEVTQVVEHRGLVTARLDKYAATIDAGVKALVTNILCYVTYNDPDISQISDGIYIRVVDVCGPMYNLIWRNDVGGHAQWCFDYNQDFEFQVTRQGKKTKVARMFANNVTQLQLEHLMTMYGGGAVYSQSYIYMPNKTLVRDGQQVYQVDTAGLKTGVIADPRNVSYRSGRDVNYNFEVDIDFPEIIQP